MTKILLWFIFLFALFLRTVNLDTIPVGIHGDEASIGYNAYSLLKTLRDQDGNFLPLSFDQFGNFRAAGYQYVAIPFIAVFGLDSLAVRLPAALFGSLTVVVFYFFLRDFFGKKNIAFIGSFLMATLPWHINLSRASSEGVISSFFVLLGTILLLKSIQLKTISFIFFSLSFLSFLISFFFYHAAGPFVILFLPFVFFLSFRIHRPSKEKVIGSCIMYIALVLGFILFLTVGSGSARVSQVSLLNVPGGTKEVKHQQDEDGNQNPLITRFFHNKLYFYNKLFLTFYSEHVSGNFLFLNNGNPIRYKMHWTGNLYMIQFPFLILGFSILLSEGIKAKKYLYLIPIIWLLIAVIPAALTWEDIPNVVRANLMIPALLMIIAFGMDEVLQIIKAPMKKILIILVAIILLQNITIFFHNYFYHSKTHEPWYRSAAVKELVFTVNNLSKQYDKVIMTTQGNNNFIFYLFYNKFDPATFHKMGSPREKDKLQFQKSVFVYNPCPLDDGSIDKTEKYVYIMKENCTIPDYGKVVDVVRHPDGSPAYHIVILDIEE